ncbi:MAG: GAF domain-containing protein, partial [Cyanobacteria bacterium P01_H01_bin.130]
MQSPDRPLIYCNAAFMEMTGYAYGEIIGRNCRFLQVPDTNQEDVDQLRAAIAAGEDCTVTLRNYRRDGSPFWNRLTISPVHNEAGQLTHYIGVQTDATLQQEKRENEQRQLQAEQLLRHVTERIRSSLDLRQVLAIAVAEVKNLLEADRVVVYRFEPDWNGVVVAEAVVPPWSASIDQAIEDTCFRENQGAAYRDGRTSAITDIKTAGLSECHQGLLQRFEVRANLVVPIINGERLWGLLIAHQCEGPRQWSPFETGLMEKVADQLALAVTQAELYQQAQAEIAQRQKAERALQRAKDSAERRL